MGTCTIVAIRVDCIEVGNNFPELGRTLSRAVTETEGWVNEPPYAVAETVFDEQDRKGDQPSSSAPPLACAACNQPGSGLAPQAVTVAP
jgi:hypothetical protein